MFILNRRELRDETDCKWVSNFHYLCKLLTHLWLEWLCSSFNLIIFLRKITAHGIDPCQTWTSVAIVGQRGHLNLNLQMVCEHSVMEGFIHWTVSIFILANERVCFFFKDGTIRFSPWLGSASENPNYWEVEDSFQSLNFIGLWKETSVRWWEMENFWFHILVIACYNWTVYQERLCSIHLWGFSRQSHLQCQAGLRGYFLAIFLYLFGLKHLGLPKDQLSVQNLKLAVFLSECCVLWCNVGNSTKEKIWISLVFTVFPFKSCLIA